MAQLADISVTAQDGTVWHCYDIGTAKYQVYAPFDVKYKLEHECNLPHTGFTLLPLLFIGALLLICAGLAIRAASRWLP
jgi:hypothetical protein